jgi:hypothetical protein
VLARVYSTPPAEQHRISLRQFRTIQQDYRQQIEQQEGG